MRLALDTNVGIYALGTESSFRTPCRRLLSLAAEGRFQPEASVELIQEFLHARARLTGDRVGALAQARDFARLLVLHPVEVEDTLRALDLYATVPGLGAIDAVHAATALRHGVDAIVSADLAFDGVPGLPRIDPRAAEAAILGSTEQPGGTEGGTQS